MFVCGRSTFVHRQQLMEQQSTQLGKKTFEWDKTHPTESARTRSFAGQYRSERDSGRILVKKDDKWSGLFLPMPFFLLQLPHGEKIVLIVRFPGRLASLVLRSPKTGIVKRQSVSVGVIMQRF